MKKPKTIVALAAAATLAAASAGGRTDLPDGAIETAGSANAIDRQVVEAVNLFGRDGVFHGYQREAIRRSHIYDLLVIEKGRRTGLTWAFAGDDVVTAATSRGEGGDDVFYMGPSHDMAREYIDACAGFAKAFMGIDASVGEFLFKDEDPDNPEAGSRDIKAFRIDFASGFSIQALTSAPRSFRGRQGKVRIDEGAFVDNLKELVKAAMAFVILGGSVVIISTHNGVDNEFNKLIQEIRAGERGEEANVYRVTFANAVADGIYEREATRRGLPMTEEAKAAWVKKIYGLYGDGAAEELDAVPSKSSGSWLPYDLIERAERKDIPVLRLSYPNEFAFKPDHIRQAEVKAWCEEHLAPLLEKLNSWPIGYGDDFARSSDLSVIWLLQERPDRSWTTPFVVEMRNVPYREQEFVRVFILERLRRWRGKVDAHGNGAYVAERLQQRFGASRVEAVKAREDWWRDQGPPLRSRFEQDRIEIPADSDTASDLRQVKVVNGAPSIPAERKAAKAEDPAGTAGKAKRHADSAVALFKASAALREGAVGDVDSASFGSTGAPSAYFGDDDAGDFAGALNLYGY
ncbi:Terminase-like family protein [compost metagenome]